MKESFTESEKQIENDCLDWLNRQPKTLAWKHNSTGIYDKKNETYRRKSRFDLNGISDIIGISDGKMLCFEIKTPETINRNTETKKSQVVFINKVKSLGAIAAIICSLEDLKNEFERQKTL